MDNFVLGATAVGGGVLLAYCLIRKYGDGEKPHQTGNTYIHDAEFSKEEV